MSSRKKSNQNQKSKDANTRDRDLQVCLWFAEMKTPQEVADLVKENYHIEYSRQSAYQFSKCIRWGRIINHLKERFLKDLSAIPIANKAIRLKYLQGIYREALTESLKSITEWGEVYELKLGAAIEALKAAREEIEGGSKTVIDQSKHITQIFLADKVKEARLRSRFNIEETVEV
jgi:hypothetical protein